MCWKQEWAMAIHNLALAEIHINRAEAKLQKRLERSQHWLEKWSKSGHAGPKGIAEIKAIITRNQQSISECQHVMASLREREKQLMRMIEVYGFKQSEDPLRTHQLMVGQGPKAPQIAAILGVSIPKARH
jgi:hypothetical protein